MNMMCNNFSAIVVLCLFATASAAFLKDVKRQREASTQKSTFETTFKFGGKPCNHQSELKVAKSDEMDKEDANEAQEASDETEGTTHEESADEEEGAGTLVLGPHSTAHEGNCSIKGVFHDPQGNAEFRIEDSFIELSIAGLPTFSSRMDKNTEKWTATIGHFSAGPDVGDSEEFGSAYEALARSAFAANNAHKLSKLLYQKGFDGGSAPCALPLHMLMVSLATASQSTAPVLLQKSDEQGKWDPYGFGSPSDPASTCPWTAPESRRPPNAWKCRKESGRRRGKRNAYNSPWATSSSNYNAKSGSRRRWHRRRRRYNTADPNKGDHGNIKCTDTGGRRRRTSCRRRSNRRRIGETATGFLHAERTIITRGCPTSPFPSCRGAIFGAAASRVGRRR